MDRQAYSINEVATSLGISRDAVNTLLRAGKLCGFHVGTRHLVSASAVAEYIAAAEAA